MSREERVKSLLVNNNNNNKYSKVKKKKKTDDKAKHFKLEIEKVPSY